MKPLNILNLITIERTTDILAFAAFLISILALGPQLYGLIDFSDIKLYPPENVLIVGHNFTEKSGKFVRFAASLTFENTGNPRYSDAVQKEYATMEIIGDKISGEKYDYIWDVIVLPKEKKGTLNEIDMIPEGISIPFKLKGGEILTHMTYFTPCQMKRKNFIKWDTFKSLLAGARQIKFNFGFSTFDGESKTVSCVVNVSKTLRDHLETNFWAYPIAHPIKAENVEPNC